MVLRGKMISSHPVKKLILWLGLIVVLTLIAVVGYNVYAGLVGEQTIGQLRTLQVAQTLCVFVVPSLLAAYIWSHDALDWLYMKQGISWPLLLLIPVLMLLDAPFINLLSHLNEQIVLPDFLRALEDILKAQEEQAAQLTEAFLRVDTLWGLMGNVVLMAILPALGEELCFRGTCLGLIDPMRQHRMQRSGKSLLIRLSGRTHIAIWVTAIIFSLIHFQFYGFVPRMLLGALLGYLLCWTGSLWAPILAHFTNNALAVVTYHMGNKGIINAESIDQFGFGDTLWAGILSLVLSAALLAVIYRHASAWVAAREEGDVPNQ